VLQTLLGYLHLLKQQVNSFFKFETLNFFKLHFVDSFFQYQHNNEKKNCSKSVKTRLQLALAWNRTKYDEEKAMDLNKFSISNTLKRFHPFTSCT